MVAAAKESNVGGFIEKAKQSLAQTLRKRGPLNRSGLLEATQGKTDIKRQALALLLADGRVSHEAGARGAKVFRLNQV